ncbi:hypothetical protein BGW36DRAFT_78544 [Talaromyces proteolyticus]|uniref:Mucin n=1 Tax=Talaromyces proteolyticus TaxID=1131652 RepID=A0AAD4KIG5_9EURO|nr:uncharacterized protein BGW36DRAFT_78544 [Talaromyces proteolyticus]KAH8689198.1 hypothetical protein BGW36DRAFT_78544 [Talaromyces proteolyticus]
MRLAQSHLPRQAQHNQRPYAKRPLHSRHRHARTVAITSPFASNNHRRKASPRLNRADHALFLDNDSWQCFHYLPPKIQQSHFTKEEQLLLQRITPAGDIVDAADRALLKFEQRRRPVLQAHDTCSNTRRRSASSSMVLSSTHSTDAQDSAIDMDESILDSFRWLDEDDLDLSLDNYHRHVAETALASRQPKPSTPGRIPSFRRTMSFNRNRNSTFIGPRTLTTSQSATVPFAGHSRRPSTSRHVSHRSTSSIDPAAQYYQDPEARLKLRVYLASPQKFDEAIEFGFPSLENKENLQPTDQSLDSKRISQISQSTQGWTFFDDQATAYDLDLMSGKLDQKNVSNNSGPQLRKVSTEIRRPQPLQPLPSGNTAAGRRREMTLKMTLTRPDLRTAIDDSQDIDDPLRLADLPPPDEVANFWDNLPEHQGVVKKMWRRICGRKD